MATYVDPNLVPYEDAIRGIFESDEALANAGLAGGNLGMLLYGPGGLGRLDEYLTPEQGSILQNARALGDPNAVGTPAGVTQAIDQAKATASGTQQLSPELQDILRLRQQEYANSRTLDPLMQEVIGLQRDALGGLSTEQMLASRELQTSELNRSLQTALGQLKGSQLVAGGPQGGPASAIAADPIVAQYAEQQQQLARQLILDDYTAKQAALDRFSNTGQYVDQAKYQRAQETLGALSGDTQQIQNNLFNQQLQAQQNLFGMEQTRQQFDVENRLARHKVYEDTFNNIRNDLLQRQVFNLNQMAKEKAGFSGAVFGSAAFEAAEQGRRESLDFAREQLEAAKEFGGAWGGIESPGGGINLDFSSSAISPSA